MRKTELLRQQQEGKGDKGDGAFQGSVAESVDGGGL